MSHTTNQEIAVVPIGLGIDSQAVAKFHENDNQQ